jgi:hypothetical protein
MQKALRLAMGVILRVPRDRPAQCSLVSANAVGRMLSLGEAGKIICRLERAIPKLAAAASVKRRGSVRTRAQR